LPAGSLHVNVDSLGVGYGLGVFAMFYEEALHSKLPLN
jgi:hypothetical protein